MVEWELPLAALGFAIAIVLLERYLHAPQGWRQLARLHGMAATGYEYGRSFRYRWVFVGDTMMWKFLFHNTHITVCPLGLHLSAAFWLRLFHPPLWIPWSDIRVRKVVPSRRTTVIDVSGVALVFFDAAAECVATAVARAANGGSVAPDGAAPSAPPGLVNGPGKP